MNCNSQEAFLTHNYGGSYCSDSPKSPDVVSPSSIPDFVYDESAHCSVENSPTIFTQEDVDKKSIEVAKNILISAVAVSVKLNLDYQLTQLIGFGSFGIVIEAFREATGEKVAIKVMQKSHIHPSRYCIDPRNGSKIPLEIALLKYTPKHPNILRFIDEWEDGGFWFLVTELAGHPWQKEPVDELLGIPTIAVDAVYKDPGDIQTSLGMKSTLKEATPIDRLIIRACSNEARIFQRIAIPTLGSVNDTSLAGFMKRCGAFGDRSSVLSGTPVLPEPVQKFIFSQLVSAVLCLHENGITHKDLKDENVLLDANLRVTLVDFGHASFYKSPDESSAGADILFKTYGTPIFSPPEARSGMKFSGPAADVYALGLMLYEMNFGDVPDDYDSAKYVEGGACVFDLSEEAGFQSEGLRDLVAWMLHPDPNQRATLNDVRFHYWFFE